MEDSLFHLKPLKEAVGALSLVGIQADAVISGTVGTVDTVHHLKG